MIPGLGKFTNLMPLASKTLDELTVSDLSSVADAFGVKVNVTQELKEAGLALLKGKDIHSVADMIQSPESVLMIVDFLNRAISNEPDDVLIGEYVVETDAPILIESRGGGASPVLSANPGWRLPT